MGAVFGAPLALAAPGSRILLLVWLLIFPAGWVVARWCKVRDPAMTAICAPVGALAALQLAEVPVALRYGGAILLAVASYAVAAYVTGAPLWQRITAALLLVVVAVVPVVTDRAAEAVPAPMPLQVEFPPELLEPAGPVRLDDPHRSYVETYLRDCLMLDDEATERLIEDMRAVRIVPLTKEEQESVRDSMQATLELLEKDSP
ncbi:hypothetical protein GCM10022248_05670 [Nonomuraea soli]